MTRKMNEILKRLEVVEQRQARQDGKEIPRCVFLSSDDFGNEEDRGTERKRLVDLYGDACHIVVVDLVGPTGTTVWKGDPGAGIVAPGQRDVVITPPPARTARQTPIAPPQTHEDARGGDFTNVKIGRGTFEQDPPARSLPADVYSGGGLDEDEEPDYQHMTAADYSREYRRRLGER